MIFRLLGPVEVVVGGRPVRCGGNRELVVLAALLLKANQLVPVTKLVEAVWAGNPPRTAEEQIPTCMWRLRRGLAAAGAPADLITTGHAGYSIKVDRGQLDTWAFEELLARSSAAADRGEHLHASELLREALALFRGPVLADIGSPVLQAAALEWEERRLAALEDRFEFALLGDAHREVIGELRAAVSEHPLRERLRGQLMRALDRSGRRAEALAAYREGRDLLVDQLGLEPGPEIQQVHQQVLAGAPAGRPAPARAAVAPPAQLPADAVDLVGRQAAIAALHRELVAARDGATAPAVCVVHGKYGVGKTALAVHVAHRLRAAFPHGQLFADLGANGVEPRSAAEVLATFLRALGVPPWAVPDDPAERAALYRSTLAGKRVLVVLDDVDDAADVELLLPGSPDSAVLVTGRSGLTELPRARRLELRPLPTDGAVEVLERFAGRDRVRAEPGASRRLVELLGGLPLAVRAIGARWAARPAWRAAHLEERLRDEAERLDTLRHGAIDVRGTILASTRRLDPATWRLWTRVSRLADPEFAVDAVRAATGLTAAEVERRLDELVDRGLLEVAGADPRGRLRYRFDPLARTAARELAGNAVPAPRSAPDEVLPADVLPMAAS